MLILGLEFIWNINYKKFSDIDGSGQGNNLSIPPQSEASKMKTYHNELHFLVTV